MQLLITGSLIAGPPEGVSTGFDTMRVNEPLLFTPDGVEGVGFGVGTGILKRNVASPAAFVALQGVGATDTVTRGKVLYLKTNAPMLIRISNDDGAGGTTTATIPIEGGPMLLRFQAAKFLKLLEVQGSGQLAYLIVGDT